MSKHIVRLCGVSVTICCTPLELSEIDGGRPEQLSQEHIYSKPQIGVIIELGISEALEAICFG